MAKFDIDTNIMLKSEEMHSDKESTRNKMYNIFNVTEYDSCMYELF